MNLSPSELELLRHLARWGNVGVSESRPEMIAAGESLRLCGLATGTRGEYSSTQEGRDLLHKQP